MPASTRRSGQKPGRTTPSKNTRARGGRYTEPIPREVRRSPSWYPKVLIILLIGGVAAIILNYMSVLPWSPTNWYTVSGLAAVLIAALAATRYR